LIWEEEEGNKRERERGHGRKERAWAGWALAPF